jgi:hypothetical protein
MNNPRETRMIYKKKCEHYESKSNEDEVNFNGFLSCFGSSEFVTEEKKKEIDNDRESWYKQFEKDISQKFRF